MRYPLLALLMLLLSACGGGGDTQSNPPPEPPDDNSNYSGPPPATADVQQFKVSLWDNIAANNRCGQCHGTGGQVPTFARNDNINLAYGEANPLVNLSEPAQSRLVTKVGGGHNCWLESNGACADTMARWISNWAGTSGGGGTTEIELRDPELKTPGASKALPEDSSLYAGTIWPLVTEYCARCHSDSAQFPQQPLFAHSDVDAAYGFGKTKIDLDTPARSRLVVRLRDEFHNCWSSCSSDAAEMEAAVSAFSAALDSTAIDEDLVTSYALRLTDGIVASGGGRYENNLIAFYQFKTGSGTTAYDTSGIEPALNLSLSGDVSWLAGWGLQFNGGRAKAQGSTTASSKLQQLITATGEYSIEAWVAPANVTQEGPARIVSYSGSTTERNLMLGQTLYNYDLLNRSRDSDGNGDPALSTADGDEVLQATLQHVVASFDPVNGRRLHVNGELVAADGASTSLAGWESNYALVLGNEVSGDRPWAGSMRLLAIYNRALSDSQINQNFAAGVGEKFFLLFSVADLINLPRTYLVFEVSQFDNYSYLFNQPFLINLDGASLPAALPMRGLRIGVNGREVAVGQVFAALDLNLAMGTNLSEALPLSRQGAVIASEKGSQSDEFFLTFDRFGEASYVRLEPEVTPPPLPADGEPQATVGLRTFAEVNASMARLTGIPRTTPSIAATYLQVEQALPATEQLETFVSSQQMAVTQLAIGYCDLLIDTPAARTALLPDLDLNAAPATALSLANRNAVLIDPLISRFMGVNLATQPASSEVSTELSNLVTRLSACGASCPVSRTAVIAKSTCAALLGSATLLLQ